MQLTEAVERPLTDIATRLQQVAKTSGADIAFYGAQVLLMHHAQPKMLSHV
jgi:uncharacterized membrane protein (UPF0136 family)